MRDQTDRNARMVLQNIDGSTPPATGERMCVVFTHIGCVRVVIALHSAA
jgi:hypothetical protein